MVSNYFQKLAHIHWVLITRPTIPRFGTQFILKAICIYIEFTQILNVPLHVNQAPPGLIKIPSVITVF